MSTVQKTNLSELPNLVDAPGHVLRRLSGDSVMMQEAIMPAGLTFAAHAHHNEQLVLVLEGWVRLDIGADAVPSELGPGDMMVIPPHVRHGGEALTDCRLIDAFSPPRRAVLGEEEPE